MNLSGGLAACAETREFARSFPVQNGFGHNAADGVSRTQEQNIEGSAVHLLDPL